MKNPIIIIAGPTASGKTDLSLELAKEFNGEIICADSMTVYKGLDIGTAKPYLGKKYSKKDSIFTVDGIPHYLLDFLDLSENFSVFEFQKRAREIITEIHKRGKIPFIVGGTGLFIDSIAYNYKLTEVKEDKKLRSKLMELPNLELLKKINEINPDLIGTGDKDNKRRLVRALEIGLNSSNEHLKEKDKEIADNVLYLGIKKDRPELYEKINSRVNEMFESGLLQEFELAYKNSPKNAYAFNSATYKPLVSLHNNLLMLDEAKEKVKQLHRNYAKRQLTWFKRSKDIFWVSNKAEAESKIKKFLAS